MTFGIIYNGKALSTNYILRDSLPHTVQYVTRTYIMYIENFDTITFCSILSMKIEYFILSKDKKKKKKYTIRISVA